MRLVKILIILILFVNNFSFAQNSTCDQAAPFCSDTGVSFENTTGAGNAPAGPDYSCVSTPRNPAWFFIRIQTAGDIFMTILQNSQADFTGANLDVDYVAWGPFTETEFQAGVCNDLTTSNLVPGNYDSSNDPNTTTSQGCSYSTDYTENFNILNAVVGEYYMIMITNFSDNSGFIKMELTPGSSGGAGPSTGATDCSILDTALGPDQDLCEGDTTTLDATPTAGTPTGYVWSVDTGSGYAVLAGETNATLDVTTSGTYQVEITDTNGNVATDEVVITFSPIPTATATTSPQQFCVSGAASIDLSLNDAAILNGQDSAVYGVAYYASQADADANTGALSNPYSTSVNQTIYAATYNLNNPDCRDTTINFDLEINQMPTITLPPAIQICDVGSDGTENYDLTQLDAGILGAQTPVADFAISYFTDNTHTTAVTTPTALVATPAVQTIYPLVTNTVTGCMSTAVGGIDISLYPLPTATQPTDMPACENPAGSGQSDFTLTDQDATILGGQAAADFTVNYYSDAGYTTQITTMPYTAVDATTIYVQVVNNLCSTTANTSFLLNVIPSSTVDAINNFTVCNGDTTGTLAFTSPQSGVSYTWVNNNTAIGLAVSGTGDLPSFTATNSTNTFIEGTITVTPEITVGGLTCQGVPRDFTIRVNPTPTVAAIASPAPYCTGDTTVAIPFTGNGVAGTVYNWVNTGDDIGMGAMSGTGDIVAFTAVNAGLTVLTATIEVTPVSPDCTGATEIFTISVNPEATVDGVASQILCSGDNSLLVAFTGNAVAGVSYEWTNDNTAIGLGASGTGDIPVFVATNAGITQLVANLTVTPVANGCSGTAQNFSITVNATPTVDAITSPAPYCTGDTTTAIAFTGNGVAGTVYNWVNTGDAIGMGAMSGTGDIAAFTTVNTGTTILIATIEVTPVSPDCIGTIETFTITVNPLPTVDAVGSQLVCNGDDTALVAFTGNAVAGVSYEWTNDNAAIGLGASGTGDIPIFTTTNTTSGQLIANLTVTPVANGCSGTAQNFTISVNPTPTVAAITSPAPYCTGDTTIAIAFTGNGVAGTVYNWVNTGDAIGMGAMSGTGDIAAFTTVNTGTTILVATIEVTPVAGCSGTTETFTITVNPIPTVDAIGDQNLCNGDTFVAVTYTGNAVAGVIYNWAVTGDDVGFGMSGAGDIASYTVVNNTTTPLIATVTVTPEANGCLGVTESFIITINGTPDVITPNNQAVCDDDNDGFWIFDLTQDEAIILNGQDPAIFEVHYYSDAGYTTEIMNTTTYQNTLAYQPDEIFMQVLNINTGCTSAIPANPNFAIEVFATPYVANAPMNLSLCDNDDLINAGSADFDLTALIPDLLGTQATDPLNSYNVTFHLTQPDADAGINAMASPFNLLTGDEITVFVRIENAALVTCVDTSASFLIHTYDSPVLVMDPSYFLCLNQGFVTITSPPFAGYQWLDSSSVVLGTNQSYDFTVGGTYSLVVNNADNCTDTRTFTVVDSENPIITDVVYTEFTDNNTIKVFVKGAITNTIVDIDHFEYALDNGAFQDSNVFEGVTPGVHHVVVRDKNGCGETIPYEVVVLGYMYYFTPNADGDHDVWRVTALQYFPDSKLYIYDRQGKIIKMLTETDAGWDGLYNGFEMPATDYWFSLILRDGREYRRHFALKR